MKPNVELFQELAIRLYAESERGNKLPLNASDEEAVAHERFSRNNAQAALISAGVFMQEFSDVEPMLRASLGAASDHSH